VTGLSRVGSPQIVSKRQTLAAQLGFALRHEQIDLLILKRLFQKVSPNDIASIVEAGPTGASARRFWFFYEWLIQERVPFPTRSRATT
jgi:hypothetical protein